MKELRKCRECGAEFYATNGNQKFCSNQHYRTCKICGNRFAVAKEHLNDRPPKLTCSTKCAKVLRAQTNLEKYGGIAPACNVEVQEKRKQTNLARYGAVDPITLSEFQEKTKKTNRDRYGTDYYSQTSDGKQNIRNLWKNEEYRSKVIAHREQTNLERYGVSCVFSNSEIKEKAKDTYQSRTGYCNPFSNPDVRNKSVQSLRTNYGVDVPLKSAELKDKLTETNLERYGAANPMQNQEIRNKAKSTMLAKYGYETYLQSPEGKEKFASTMLDRYGVKVFSETDAFKLSAMKNPERFEQFKEFDSDPESYIDTHFDHIPSLNELADDIGTGTEAVSLRLDRCNCRDKVKYVFSYMEDQVYTFLHNLNPSLIIVRNTKKIIAPYELDLYLPELNLGIECNPTSTHNSSVNTWDKNSSPLKRNYHQMKTKMCEDRGIFLFHIFGYEWETKRTIIESMLRNLIGQNERVIYARRTVVKEVPGRIAADFLDKNHRQGNTFSSVRLGLYTKDSNELVSLMTFGKMRSTIGTSREDLSSCWELVRFCSELNTTIVGGASKLLASFIETYNPLRIRSFSDRSHTRGTLYEKLGFTEIRRSDPGYVWVNLSTDIAYHRVNAQKQHLKKFLNDDSIDLNKTEKEIMTEHNFVQVYDSGTITWEWKNSVGR